MVYFRLYIDVGVVSLVGISVNPWDRMKLWTLLMLSSILLLIVQWMW